ncbi:MAG TPA: FtsX-like permease family protein [Phycisphaerales bacterium]|nr:FtsX-like permease family protein [Phycisphaerales bacterium]
MYQALLTRRYLFSKIMPLLAAVAVMLCTTMVLVTWSVMGGFLNMLIGTGRTLTGDVTVMWPTTGFRHYEDLIKRLEADPLVAAAAPMIETPGMINLPGGRTEWIMVRGIDGPSFARVTEYADILWWKPLDKPLPKDKLKLDERLHTTMLGKGWEDVFENGLHLKRPNPETGVDEAAAVLGIEVTKFNKREIGGFYTPYKPLIRTPDGKIRNEMIFMPANGRVTINVLPTDPTGKGVETATAVLPVANEFQSGLYEADNKTVFVRLDVLQRMLRMQPYTSAEPPPLSGEETFATGEQAEALQVPGRVTHVLVKGKGAESDASELKKRVQQVYAEFEATHRGQVPPDPEIRTWREQNAMFIGAVEKETALVMFLFCMISAVAVVLILAIFWSMVAEKTKDIGILRAMGASKLGVAWVWIRYGLVIGVVGGLLGGLTAFLIVHNINPIHEWMGRALDIQIWDPRVYYFTTIPNKIDPTHAAIVVIGFILASGVGAVVPATRAALLHPVRALRFE